ncbi:hypothetical protein QR680_018693 [Steinernema hermaphroditum]|uniref:Protein SEC13 homolog n=1 Tax=Steinernema hermaphroditum TaxID=289476 RepID=A0AA39HL20_9BILA|nr:hypothetical protein QR680_018685 [Steinernema hermaphroditum]KAK0406617.1 hypothetical protein QR680_018693 [Steinernema hermaphroditum]
MLRNLSNVERLAIETRHNGIVNDAKVNLYGNRLATCSSDASVRVFDLDVNGRCTKTTHLHGHTAPVWQVSWACFPSSENHLASCGDDGRLIVWREKDGKMQKFHETSVKDAKCTSVCWAPRECGLTLASGLSDGNILILVFDGTRWVESYIRGAHQRGTHLPVSWAPVRLSVQPPGHPQPPFVHLASGGRDGVVRIWTMLRPSEWNDGVRLSGHDEEVLDVAWAQTLVGGPMTVASIGMDGKLIIWRCADANQGPWSSRILHSFQDIPNHVTWSPAGNVLIASIGCNKFAGWTVGTDPDDWTQVLREDDERTEEGATGNEENAAVESCA